MSAVVAMPATRRAFDVPRRWPGAVLLGLTGALIVATIALSAVGPPVNVVRDHLIEGVTVTAVFPPLGVLLMRRVPGNAIGPLFCLVGLAEGVADVASAYSLYADQHGLPLLRLAAWLNDWTWALSVAPMVTALPLLFPDGRAPTRRWRPVVWLSVAVTVVWSGCLATSNRLQVTPQRSLPNPLRVPGSGELLATGSVLFGAVVILCLVSLVVRYRAADAQRRQQIRPVVIAGALAIVGTLATDWNLLVAATVQLVTFPLVGLATATCILRRRLYELDVFVRRSLLYVGLSALIVAAYVAIVQAVATIIHGRPGIAGSLIATAVIAAVFAPARAWLQDVIVRLLYGQRRDPVAAVQQLAGRLQVVADPATALAEAVDVVADALRVPWVALRLDDDREPTAVSGPRPGWLGDDALVAVPLRHAGRDLGQLVVAPRSPGEPLHTADRQLVAQLGGAVSATVAAHRLTEDLRSSRERLVISREEERRRLRHDLHDGVGPHLAALGVLTDLAIRQLDRPEAAASTLAELRRTTDDVLADVRHAVEDLRPAAVDELGLAAAIETHLRQLVARTDPSCRLTVTAVTPQPLPAAVEVAAFRIVLEAATNALRHAGAATVSVDVRPTPDVLHLAVTDDGCGVDPGSAQAGVGVLSMATRAEELGGSFSLAPEPGGGTRMTATLPLTARREAAPEAGG